MRTVTSQPPSDDDQSPAGREADQCIGNWNAEIALIVASTLDPSCAFAYCFARRHELAEGRSRPHDEVSKSDHA